VAQVASIQTGIELNDYFTGVLNDIMASVNLTIYAMEGMQGAMNADIDTSSLENARAAINQATIAVNELEASMGNLSSPVVGAPQIERPAARLDPVAAPVAWQTDGLDVFTSFGVERFQQEVQSANTMLQQLCSTQDAIARQAYNTTIFPPEAFQNLNSMAVRMDGIRDQIQMIENNPLNMGTDAANAGVEQLRTQLAQMVAEQEALNSAVQNMDVQAANDAYLRLSQTIGDTERYIRDNVDEQGRFNREIDQGAAGAGNLVQMILGAVAAYATLQTAANVVSASDELVQTSSRLEMMNDGLQTTQDLMNMVYLSAQNARGSFAEMAGVVARFGNNAGEAFGSSAEVVAFAELVQKQMTIAGASTAEASAAMLQLSQALGSGVLRGDELNSIFEQAPNLIQNIADYLGVGIGEIREMASEGELTADVVKSAIFAAAEEINADFASMPMTWGQVFQSFQNTALMAFQPVLTRINELANSTAFQEFAVSAAETLAVAASIALQVFELLAAGAQTAADNWSWLAPIIYGVVGVLAVYYGAMLLYNTVTAISAGITAMKAFQDKVHSAALMMETGATFTATAAQYGFNAALLACPITWIIVLIIALVALFYAAVAAVNNFAGTSVSATGIICGAVAAAGAFILNTGIGLINGILQAVWAFVEPFIGIVEWILNVANGGFDSFGGAVANLIGNIISWFLSLGMVVTRIIDAIFGTDWTAGLSDLQDTVLSWGKTEDAVTIDRTAPMIDYRLDYQDAWDAGYSFGEGIDESIANFDPASLFGATDIPAPEDYAGAMAGVGGLGSDVADIAGNTEEIADGMEFAEEDLKYLRDIAEQEQVNRYTVAEVNIDMTGMQNTIQNGDDLDGFMSNLTDAVHEAVDNMMEGVHE